MSKTMSKTAILRTPSGAKKSKEITVGEKVVKKIEEQKYIFNISPVSGTITAKIMRVFTASPGFSRGNSEDVMWSLCRASLFDEYGTFFSFEKPLFRINASFFNKYSGEFGYISLHDTYSESYWFLYMNRFNTFVKVEFYSEDGLDLVKFYPMEAGTKGELDAAVEWLSKAVAEFYVPKKERIEETHTIDLLSARPDGLLQWVNKSFDGKLCNMDNAKICLNYGDAFLKTHDLITSGLIQKPNGIYLFNGPPGTGKTTYIKHLIGAVNKNFLYVPEQLIKDITSPQFTNMLLQQEDSVLILEDAERAITKRDSVSATSAISNILNMSDGIVGSILKMPIIITFNCELKEIDTAILRKGRCVCNHTFGPLEPSSVKKLAKTIGKSIPKDVSDHPMTLADIYNYGE